MSDNNVIQFPPTEDNCIVCPECSCPHWTVLIRPSNHVEIECAFCAQYTMHADEVYQNEQ